MAKGFKTGGRTKGTPNLSSLDVKELAKEYGPLALKAVWSLAQRSDSDQVRLAANSVILDRAYGKPSQYIEGDLGGIVIQVVKYTGEPVGHDVSQLAKDG